MSKLRRWGIVALVVVVVAIYFLPTLLAQRSVRAWIVDELLAKEGMEAEMESLRLGWFSPTRVSGLQLGPPDRPRLVHVRDVRSDRTFWKGLTEGVDVGDLSLQGVQVHLWFGGDTSNLKFPKTDEDAEEPGDPPEDKELVLSAQDIELWIKTDTMPEELLIFRNVDLTGRLQKGPAGRLLAVSPGRVLDRVSLSPELCEGGLKFIVPILSEATWTRGELSMELDACVIDLEHPEASQIAGTLTVHDIEAGIKNPLVAAAGKQLGALLGKTDVDTIHLADNSTVRFQVRDGVVWHEGVEFGLPRVDERLVVRTSGSVGFDESLDLTVDLPVPLHLVANGPLAEALSDSKLTVRARGSLDDPQLEVADDDLVGSLVKQLAGQAKGDDGAGAGTLGTVLDVVSALREARDASRAAKGDPEDAAGGSFLDRMRARRQAGGGLLQQILGGGDDDAGESADDSP